MTTNEKTLQEKLVEIQSELKAPKGQFNSFSNFKYRSAEDILEAAKPLCHSRGVSLRLSDEMVEIGGRVYVKAVAMLNDNSDKEVFTIAYAREELTKKGMDAAQITGSASSYARKYALNGLFCIDDTKDADSHDNRQHVSETKPVTPAVMLDAALSGAKDQLNRMLEQFGYDNPVKKKAFISKVLNKSTVSTVDEADSVMAELTNEGAEL